MDDRPVPRLRVNGEVAADDLQPLLHAGQAEPAPSHRLLRVEAGARILDCEVDGVDLSVQRDVGVTRPAMLDDILQGFLQDAVETQ